MQYQHAEAPALGGGQQAAPAPGSAVRQGQDAPQNAPQQPAQAAAAAPFVRDVPKVGRNEACPCGSGKKYKQCHGKLS